eukprot:TRINITY_DN2236_c0_g1_i1.p1 TRINITY_DN2236_c0_g1~~TRINITY_DN2236_c0_g1_i1.p1  ORF type:complete len:314 (+),score=54.59 TRINITY_DN2236_c0_g1_i1:3-944(+)
MCIRDRYQRRVRGDFTEGNRNNVSFTLYKSCRMKVLSFVLLSVVFTCCLSQSLYISFHGGSSGINNIYKYSTSGYYKGTLLTSTAGLDELRGMAVDPVSNKLYFCNSHETDSFIGVVDQCGGAYAQYSSSNLAHPYGIAISSSGEMYVSNQDGAFPITRFNISVSSNGAVFTDASSTTRGLALDAAGNIYFASETANVIEVFNPSGSPTGTIQVDTPIGVHVDQANNMLYVGSNGATKAIYSYNIANSLSITAKYTQSGFGHPAGIAVINGVLYALDQKHLSLVAWNVASSAYLGTIVSGFGDAPEDLLAVSC